MSGPKCYSYSVESPAERLARETRQTQARCAEIRDQLHQANRERVALGLTALTPGQAAGDSLESWQTHAAALEHLLDEATRGVQAARSETAWAAMRQAVAGVTTGTLGLSLDQRAAPTGGEPALAQDAGPRRWGQMRASVDRALESASRLEDSTARDAFVAQAAAVFEADGLAAAEARRTRLILAVSDATRQQATTARCRRETSRRLLAIAHIESAQAETLRREATDVTTPEQAEDLAVRIDELLATERAREDAAFVAEQTRAALESLGYEVDAPPASGPETEQALLAYRRDLPDHVLAVNVDPASHSLSTSVLACADTTEREDVEAEELTCVDVEALGGELFSRGVAADRVAALGIGAVRLEHDHSLRRGGAAVSRTRPAPAQALARERRTSK